jgi:LPXTG-motif cell wall-anchored protein
MTQGTVQLVAGILCLVVIAIIFLRRKGKKKTEDDF